MSWVQQCENCGLAPNRCAASLFNPTVRATAWPLSDSGLDRRNLLVCAGIQRLCQRRRKNHAVNTGFWHRNVGPEKHNFTPERHIKDMTKVQGIDRVVTGAQMYRGVRVARLGAKIAAASFFGRKVEHPDMMRTTHPRAVRFPCLS